MSRTQSNGMNGFRDYYEILQLSPNADADTITRVYRILVKRYHPDNQTSANSQKFAEVLEAYRVLADEEKRTAYDLLYEENRAAVLKIFEDTSDSSSFESDKRILDGILSLLYVARRRDPVKGTMGTIHIERLLGCPGEHLEFHLWYLLEKKWIERLSNGMFAITAAGVDRMVEEDSIILRRNRLLAEKTAGDTTQNRIKEIEKT